MEVSKLVQVFLILGLLGINPAQNEEITDFCLTPQEGCTLLVSTQMLSVLTYPVVGLYKTLNKAVYVKPDDVEFWLFTKGYQTPEEIFADTRNLDETRFDKSKRTKFFIHGWGQNGNTYRDTLVPAIFNNTDVNLILVDWSKHADYGYIKTRTYCVDQVGTIVGNFIDNLHEKGVPLDLIHVIGHSLGAHVSGSAGENMKSGKLARITALDPAGPLFYTVTNDQKLDSSDAEFVDVIHTDAGGLGYNGNLGHADFYPNGGRALQPGCPVSDKLINCSHHRSVEFYTESISANSKFYAHKCKLILDSMVDTFKSFITNEIDEEEVELMGEPASNKARGTFCLQTADKYPYATGRKTEDKKFYFF